MTTLWANQAAIGWKGGVLKIFACLVFDTLRNHKSSHISSGSDYEEGQHGNALRQGFFLFCHEVKGCVKQGETRQEACFTGSWLGEIGNAFPETAARKDVITRRTHSDKSSDNVFMALLQSGWPLRQRKLGPQDNTTTIFCGNTASDKALQLTHWRTEW